MQIEPLNQFTIECVWEGIERGAAMAQYDPMDLTDEQVAELLGLWLLLIAPAGRG